MKGLAQVSAFVFDTLPPFLFPVCAVCGGFPGTLSLTVVPAKGSCGNSGVEQKRGVGPCLAWSLGPWQEGGGVRPYLLHVWRGGIPPCWVPED